MYHQQGNLARPKKILHAPGFWIKLEELALEYHSIMQQTGHGKVPFSRTARQRELADLLSGSLLINANKLADRINNNPSDQAVKLPSDLTQDLAQEGVMAVYENLDRYNPPSGVFPNWVEFTMLGAMLRYVSNNGYVLRIPVWIHDKLKSSIRRNKNERDLVETVEELLPIPRKGELPLALMASLVILSIQGSYESLGKAKQESSSMNCYLATPPEPSPEYQLIARHRNEVIRDEVERLPPTLRQTVALKLGFHDQDPMSNTQIGNKMGIEKEDVSYNFQLAKICLRRPQPADRIRRAL